MSKNHESHGVCAHEEKTNATKTCSVQSTPGIVCRVGQRTSVATQRSDKLAVARAKRALRNRPKLVRRRFADSSNKIRVESCTLIDGMWCHRDVVEGRAVNARGVPLKSLDVESRHL